MIAWRAQRLFDGERFHDGMALLTDGDRVVGLVPVQDIPGQAEHRFVEGTLAPGFVDLQVNGGGGIMLNEAPSVASLRQMAEAHARIGVTTILPTLITDRPEIVAAAIDAVAAGGVPGVAGLHLEGPHLALSRKGAHDGGLIRAMTAADLAALIAAAARLPVLKVTLAPEAATPGQIAALAWAGVLVSLGHTEARLDACRAATEAGARCVTHLFNAMSQMTGRAPGCVGAALEDGRLSAGIIADGHHVDPVMVRLARRAKRGPGRMFLVSDAMAVAGTDLRGFDLGGRAVTRRGGRLTLADGTLAGADLDLARAVRNMVDWDAADEAEALAMAMSVPAALIGRRDLGRLAAGCRADLVALEGSGAVTGVWRGGVAVDDETVSPHLRCVDRRGPDGPR